MCSDRAQSRVVGVGRPGRTSRDFSRKARKRNRVPEKSGRNGIRKTSLNSCVCRKLSETRNLVLCIKRRHERSHLVTYAPEGPNITLFCVASPLDLLRRHVERRSDLLSNAHLWFSGYRNSRQGHNLKGMWTSVPQCLERQGAGCGFPMIGHLTCARARASCATIR